MAKHRLDAIVIRFIERFLLDLGGACAVLADLRDGARGQPSFRDSLRQIAERGLAASPISEILIERSMRISEMGLAASPRSAICRRLSRNEGWPRAPSLRSAKTAQAPPKSRRNRSMKRITIASSLCLAIYVATTALAQETESALVRQ